MNGDKVFLEEDIHELRSERRFVITKRKKGKEGGCGEAFLAEDTASVFSRVAEGTWYITGTKSSLSG